MLVVVEETTILHLLVIHDCYENVLYSVYFFSLETLVDQTFALATPSRFLGEDTGFFSHETHNQIIGEVRPHHQSMRNCLLP